MAKIPNSDRELDVLVNCKTYPAVSKKYTETVCTGGIDRDGNFVRLYPIPFRFLENEEKYERWNVIRVKVYKDDKDNRPESWHLIPGIKITILGRINREKDRWDWMRGGVYSSTKEMKQRGYTNGLVQIEPTELYWKPENKKWSSNQLAVFNQGNLFHEMEEIKAMSERVPWQFRLKFKESNTGEEFDQKILAWSYYQGYRRNLEKLQDENEALKAVRDKVHTSILDPTKIVYAIFGTHSRFNHWMVSGIYHLPRKIHDQSQQFLF